MSYQVFKRMTIRVWHDGKANRLPKQPTPDLGYNKVARTRVITAFMGIRKDPRMGYERCAPVILQPSSPSNLPAFS